MITVPIVASTVRILTIADRVDEITADRADAITADRAVGTTVARVDAITVAVTKKDIDWLTGSCKIFN